MNTKQKELPHNWHTKLAQYGSYLTRNKWDAEDLTQEVAKKAIVHYKHDQQSMALLKKMATHSWMDTLRKRRHEQLTDEIPEPSYTDRPVENRLEAVEVLLERLTPKQAVVFFLKEAFQYKSRELAELLGMSEESVKGTLHRARNRIRHSAIRSIQPMEPELVEVLHPLLTHALTEEDPSILLEAIPSLPLFNNSSLSPMCLAA